MSIYQVPWLLYSKYDNQQKKMIIHMSNHMKSKINSETDTLFLNFDEIIDFIHKYDYRKLNYFSSHPTHSTFDTLIRFKFDNLKQPIKTHAVCQNTPHGFECIHVEEIDVIKTKRFLKNEQFNDLKQKINWNDENDLKGLVTRSYSKYRTHLFEIIQR
jgi:hypothetical protein